MNRITMLRVLYQSREGADPIFDIRLRFKQTLYISGLDSCMFSYYNSLIWGFVSSKYCSILPCCIMGCM